MHVCPLGTCIVVCLPAWRPRSGLVLRLRNLIWAARDGAPCAVRTLRAVGGRAVGICVTRSGPCTIAVNPARPPRLLWTGAEATGTSGGRSSYWDED